LPPIESMKFVRAKMFRNELGQSEFNSIINDIVHGKYSNVFLSAFITGCTGKNLNTKEIGYLTEAMIETGNKLTWPQEIIADKHSIGGLPGNRTTLIVVPILASLGITI